MSYNPQNPNGQTTSANSSPVVIASDQSAVDTNQAKVGGNNTSTNNGTSDTGTQRVTLASDSTGQVISRGNVASGTTDSGNPVKIGGKYNASPPTFTDGQRGDLQLDASGNLKTAVSGSVGITANSSVNVNQIGGTAVATNSGSTSAGTQRVVLATDQPALTNALKVDGSAVTQPISAASLPLPSTAATSTKQSDGSQKTQIVDGSGNVIGSTSNALDVNIKSNAVGGGTSSAFGAALPSTGTAAGFTDGTNMQAARTYDSDSGAGTENTLGIVLRKTASGGSVEAGTGTNPLRTDPTGTTTQPVSGTVTANVGTTNGLALDASVTGLQVSQGSSTSGQKGDLVLGAVTTAAPTYTTAQTSPLSLTTGGALRVDGSTSTQPVSGTVTSNAGTGTFTTNEAQIAGTTTSVNNGTTDAGTQRVTLSSDSTGQVIARGNVASASADSGNPVKIGGVFNSSAPTFTNGQRGDLQIDAAGNLKTTMSSGSAVSINDGTTTANNIAGDTGQNAQIVAPIRKEVTFSVSGSAATTATDVSNYRWVSVQVAAIGSSPTVTFQGSNDNVNFVSVALMSAGTTSGAANLTTAATGISHGPINFRYFRLNISATGVTSGAIEFFGAASAMQSMGITGSLSVTQSGTWTVQPGNTANTTAWFMNAGQVAGTATAVNTGTASAGTQRVVLATDQPALTNSQPVNLAPSTSGGWSVSSQTNLTTTATVSGAVAKFGGYMFLNLNATPAYIQVFNLATSGAVTLGTTTPTFVVPIPANSTAANGAGANLELTNGIAMSTGIQVAATTTATGATTVTTGLTGFVLFK